MAFSDVLLHFPELLVTDNRVGVFLTIDDALLQAVEGFRPGERIGFDAPGTEGGSCNSTAGTRIFRPLRSDILVMGCLELVIWR